MDHPTQGISKINEQRLNSLTELHIRTQAGSGCEITVWQRGEWACHITLYEAGS